MRRLAVFVGLSVMCVGVIGAPRAATAATADERGDPAVAASVLPAETVSRPRALAPLYISFAALQVLDVHSTLRAADVGGVEANPVVGGMVESPAVFVAAKVGMTAGMYLVAERLWKRNHKTAAVLAMIAVNSTYGVIVAHNYAVEARAARTGSR